LPGIKSSGARVSGEDAVWQVAGRDCGLLRAHYVRQSFPRHSHDCFVVCVNERGAHASWYAGSTVVIPAGAITIVPPGEVHTGHPVLGAPWHYRAMYPSAAFIATLAAEVGLADGVLPAFAGLVLRDAELAAAFVHAHRRCEALLDPLELEARVAEILLAVLRRHARGARLGVDRRSPHRAVMCAVEYIHDCHAHRITLDELAKAAGLSRHGLLRAFRREVGIPPYALVTQVRIEHARRLLQTGGRHAA
jgi:hypothetical protein